MSLGHKPCVLTLQLADTVVTASRNAICSPHSAESAVPNHFGTTDQFSSSAGKESTCNVGDLGSIPGLGRSPG